MLLGRALPLFPALPAPARTAAPVSPVPIAVPPPPADADLATVEPVIPDAEVATEAPPVDPSDDPELQRPLASVTEFEQRMTGQPAAPAATAPAPGQPPLGDRELARPLPPSEQFDVREVELAEPEPTSETPELHYAVRAEGQDAADALTDVGLQRQFDDLTALDDGGGKATNEAMLSARLEEDSKLLRRMLPAEGWYVARVDTRLGRSAAKDGQPVSAVLLVVPGERYAPGTVTVTAEPTMPRGVAAEQGASLAFRRSNTGRRDRNALDWETQSASCVTDSLTQPIGGARGTH